MNKYPGFYEALKIWFLSMRKKDPRFHCAEAGRNKIDQEVYFSRGASKAHFGQSSHNYNAGMDTFFQVDGKYCLDRNLYDAIMIDLDPMIAWYGSVGAEFFELPHVELKNWLQLKAYGTIKLIQ